jgi:hypothetical protein
LPVIQLIKKNDANLCPFDLDAYSSNHMNQNLQTNDTKLVVYPRSRWPHRQQIRSQERAFHRLLTSKPIAAVHEPRCRSNATKLMQPNPTLAPPSMRFLSYLLQTRSTSRRRPHSPATWIPAEPRRLDAPAVGVEPLARSIDRRSWPPVEARAARERPGR